MSRNTKDYSQGKIYCIRNSISDDIYVGSTCQSLSQRMAQHRRDMTARQHLKLYTTMRELGRENFYIELLEECPCENFSQLLRREGELIREHKSTLNNIISGRTKKEYFQDNREKISDKSKEYYEHNKDKVKKKYVENRDKILEYKKQYAETHKETIKNRNMLHYQDNSEKIKHQKKEYYQNNKEREQARSREYQNNNREKVRESNRQYYARKKQMKEN